MRERFMGGLAGLVLAGVLLSPGAGAVIHDLCDGNANLGPPADDPGFAHVGSTGLTVTYVGNGWVLTAAHVAAQDVTFGGVVYPYVPGSRVQIQNASPPDADLAVWRVEPHPNLPVLPIRSAPLALASEVVMIGNGRHRGAATSWMGLDGYLWGTGGAIRWGSNRVAGTGIDVSTVIGDTRSFSTDFSAPPPPLGTPPCDPPPVPPPDPRCAAGEACPEAQASVGDSGGAVFVKNGSTWELAGVMHAIGEFGGQPEAALYTNLTYSADLSHALYRDQIIALVRPECSDEVDNDGDGQIDGADPGCLFPEDDHESPDCTGADSDGDGVADVCDGCLDLANPSQLDIDGDGCGNLCDADFDQDGAVVGLDYVTMRACVGRAAPSPGGPFDDPTCEESDLDGDGAVAGTDFVGMLGMLGGVAGPSLDPHRDPVACP